MSLVKFDVNSFLEFENSFKEQNNTILENIEIINNELKEIGEILNTPNSSKTIPTFIDQLDEMKKFVEKNGNSFDKCFLLVKSEYNDFDIDVKKAVGGTNG